MFGVILSDFMINMELKFLLNIILAIEKAKTWNSTLWPLLFFNICKKAKNVLWSNDFGYESLSQHFALHWRVKDSTQTVN